MLRTAGVLIGATLMGIAGFGESQAGMKGGTRSPTCDPDELERQMRERGVDPTEFPNPFAVSQDLRETARSVAGAGSAGERMRRLQRFLVDAQQFTFTSDPRATFGATATFEARRGNCVSFTTLFIAMGCAAGIPLRPALKTIGDAEREGDLILINDHVVAVLEGSPDATVFDFNVRSERDWVGLRLISDLSLVAIHANNLGVAATLDGDVDRAAVDFEAATRLRPGFAEAFGNLGVVRRRAGDDDGALEAYRAALEGVPDSPTILHNLAALYESMDRPAEAFAALQAARLRDLNPYTLIVLGDFRLREGHVKRALKLYRRSARKGSFIPEPQVAIARAESARGRPRAARAALRKALTLDPDHQPAAQLLERIGFED